MTIVLLQLIEKEPYPLFTKAFIEAEQAIFRPRLSEETEWQDFTCSYKIKDQEWVNVTFGLTKGYQGLEIWIDGRIESERLAWKR